MSDEDTARAGDEPEPDTGIVDRDTTQTPAAAVAWSLDTEEGVAPAADRRPLPRSLMLLLTAVGVAAIALTAFIVGQHRAGPPSTAPVVSPPAVATTTVTVTPVPPAATPPPAPSASTSEPTGTSEIDAQYLRYLRDNNVPYRSGDADAIASGHEICSALETRTLVDETDSVRRALSWTRDDAAALVGAAVAYYCPQHVP